MAFCEYCGKKLEEGQVCDCQQSVNARQSAPTQPNVTQQQTTSFQDNEYVKASKEAAKNAWQLLLHILKKPASGSVDYVKEGDLVSAIIMIAVQAIAVMLYVWLNFAKIPYASELVPTAKLLFVVLICSLAASAALAGIVMGVAKVVKANCDFGRALRVTAARSIVVIPLVVVAAVLALASANIAAYVFFFSSIAGLVFLVSGMQAIPEMDMNKSIYAICITVAVHLIVYAIIFKLGCKAIIPVDDIMDAITSYGSMLSNF